MSTEKKRHNFPEIEPGVFLVIDDRIEGPHPDDYYPQRTPEEQRKHDIWMRELRETLKERGLL